MPRKKKDTLNNGNFTLKNTLLTLRFWSQQFTTSLFDKDVKDFTLVCQFPLNNFNLEILKNAQAAQLYLDVEGKVYIARIKGYIASVTPQAVVLQIALCNIRLKVGWDMEFSTPSIFYEQILSDKSFFKIEGKKLEEYVRPLGISRKLNETDQAFRRRTIEYLNYKIGNEPGALSEEDINKLRGQ